MFLPTIPMDVAVKTALTLGAQLLGFGAVTIDGVYQVGFILKDRDENRYLVTLNEGLETGETVITTLNLSGLAVKEIPPPPAIELVQFPDPRQIALNLEAAAQTVSEPEGLKPVNQWTPTNPPPVDSDLL